MNTTDKDREEAMEELAVGIVALCIHEGPVVEQMGEIKEMIRDYDARVRAEAKAEARREAAELAVYWVHQEYPKQDDPVRQQAIDDSLRAAVRAVEHCNNPAQTRKDWAKEVITPLRHWIENTHGDLPASRLTGYEVMEIFSILADEPNKEE